MGWSQDGRARGRANGWFVLIVAGASAACAESDGPRASEPSSDSTWSTVSSITPELPNVAALDREGNHIDDVLDDALLAIRTELASSDPTRRAAAQVRLDEKVVVEAIFSEPISAREIEVFKRGGGTVRHVFRAVSYGFTGRLPRGAVEGVARALGPKLLLLKADRFVERHLDQATRNGRVRPVWAPGFAGAAAGFNGSSSVNIAIVDTGVDASHPDLAGRMVGWKDYSSEGSLVPTDVGGHGSHVAGIALGSGASFGVGPGTLRYTDRASLVGFANADWAPSPVHLPDAFTLTSSATWIGGGTSTLALMRNNDGATGSYTTVSPIASGAGPLALSFTGTAPAGTRFSLALTQNVGLQITKFAVANSVTSYPAVGDGFPALRGVAPGSGWYGAKIFPAVGNATSADIAEAMDDIVVLRTSLNIKVANMSFGVPNGGADPTQRSKANTMVANGIVVVASNGNNGSSTATSDPGRAANVITVGAANDVNALTQYTSAGITGGGADVDDKPDLLAPGGSRYRSKILSVDANSSDADDASIPDAQADDYANIMGTSMAAPLVAGSAALLIEALEQSGTPWSFASTDSPFLVKMLLSASATETNDTRELGGGSPSLGRASAPKDLYEGYGMVNPDAAIEAVTLGYAGESFSASTTGAVTDRRAWGRKMTIPAGRTLKLSLDVPSAADFDLYLYRGQPGAKGNPILEASSARAGLGEDEVLTAPFAATTNLYVFVKRVTGNGTFTLTGSTFVCGNNIIEPGEQCDDGNVANGDCCSGTCQLDANGSACSDGSACTQTDTCNAGTCTGSNPVTCTASDVCHDVGTCIPATGVCTNPPIIDGAPCSDGDACTQTDTCQNGTCLGSSPVVCGAAESCSEGGVCNPTTGTCSSAAKPDGTSCSDGSACTTMDTCTAGVCTSGTAVVCVPPDECHQAACVTQSGLCAVTAKADGVACSKGSCIGGVCVSADAGALLDAGVDAALDGGADDAEAGVPVIDSGAVEAGGPGDASTTPPPASAPAEAGIASAADAEERTLTARGNGCSCETVRSRSPDDSPLAPLLPLGAAVIALARRRRRGTSKRPAPERTS